MGEEEEDGVVVVAMDAAMGGTIALDMVIVELFDYLQRALYWSSTFLSQEGSRVIILATVFFFICFSRPCISFYFNNGAKITHRFCFSIFQSKKLFSIPTYVFSGTMVCLS